MATIPILVPIAYIVLLVGALLTFSRIYRKRAEARIAGQEPWFASHPERDTYISLLQLSPPPSDGLLKAALLRRAVADVHRILAFREDKAALQALLQKGSVGDDLWNAFLAAEKELEAEIVEVVNEAATFNPGWGQFIFQSASEMVNNQKNRELFLSIASLRAETDEKYGIKRPPPVTPAPKPVPATLSVSAPTTSAPTTPKKKANNIPLQVPTTSSPASSVNGDPSISPMGSPKAQGSSKKPKKKK
ncbi:translocation protein S66 [Tulasnella sp. 419]|nr:translocation protein S66 [Tulasnella sp. 419]